MKNSTKVFITGAFTVCMFLCMTNGICAAQKTEVQKFAEANQLEGWRKESQRFGIMLEDLMQEVGKGNPTTDQIAEAQRIAGALAQMMYFEHAKSKNIQDKEPLLSIIREANQIFGLTKYFESKIEKDSKNFISQATNWTKKSNLTDKEKRAVENLYKQIALANFTYSIFMDMDPAKSENRASRELNKAVELIKNLVGNEIKKASPWIKAPSLKKEYIRPPSGKRPDTQLEGWRTESRRFDIMLEDLIQKVGKGKPTTDQIAEAQRIAGALAQMMNFELEKSNEIQDKDLLLGTIREANKIFGLTKYFESKIEKDSKNFISQATNWTKKSNLTDKEKRAVENLYKQIALANFTYSIFMDMDPAKSENQASRELNKAVELIKNLVGNEIKKASPLIKAPSLKKGYIRPPSGKRPDTQLEGWRTESQRFGIMLEDLIQKVGKGKPTTDQIAEAQRIAGALAQMMNFELEKSNKIQDKDLLLGTIREANKIFDLTKYFEKDSAWSKLKQRGIDLKNL